MNKRGIRLIFLLAATSVIAKDIQLLSVSYDPARELYKQCSRAFSAYWKQRTGDNVVVRQSYGGSSKQATSVTNGIETGVVTLTLAYDVDAIAGRGRIDKEWVKYPPDNFTPCTSTIIFLVRKGNPKRIHDQNDLIKPGAPMITPNLKSSGGARQNYLAAWGYALHHNSSDQAKAQGSIQALYKNVEVLDSDTHSSTNTFVERGIDDVLITWENETLLTANELGKDKFEIVTPGESILVESTVSVIDKVIEKKGTKEVVEAYLEYFYSPEGQEITVKNYYHPRDAEVAEKYENAFPKLKLFTIDEEFGSWTKVQKRHFTNGGTFDQINRR